MIHYNAYLRIGITGEYATRSDVIAALENMNRPGEWRVDVWKGNKREVIGMQMEVRFIDIDEVVFHDKSDD